MTDLRTPFKIAQSIDDVLYIMKRTNRRRLAVQFQGREGVLFINMRGKKDKDVQSEMQGHSFDMTQNFTVWYYLSDCTLKFKRYRGLDNKGHDCFRIIHIGEPEPVKDRSSSFVPRGTPITVDELAAIAEEHHVRQGK